MFPGNTKGCDILESVNDRFLQYIEEQTKVEFTAKLNINIMKKDILLLAERFGVVVSKKDLRL